MTIKYVCSYSLFKNEFRGSVFNVKFYLFLEICEFIFQGNYQKKKPLLNYTMTYIIRMQFDDIRPFFLFFVDNKISIPIRFSKYFFGLSLQLQ